MTSPDMQQRTRKHPLANCEDCTLYHGKHVPSKFPTKPSNGLVFLGESPGREEKRAGEPFVGKSGQVLDAVFEEYGIERDATLLTNAASCNYRDEEKSVLPQAIECCRPRLLSEISQSGAHTAVTLGNVASKSLLDTKTGITKLRGGPPKESDYLQGLNVVPTFHPAACLRNQQNFPLFERDITKALPNAKPPTWIEPVIHVITDSHTALKTLRRAQREVTSPLVVDTESAWDKDTSFTRNTNILCVGLGSTSLDHGEVVIVIGKPAIVDSLVQRELIKLIAKVGMVAQNAKYDKHVLNAINAENREIKVTYDTMLASYSLNEVPGIHGLKYMSNEYLGAPHYEEEIKEYLKAPKDSPEVRALALSYLRDALGDGSVLLRTEVMDWAPEGLSEAVLKRAAKELHVSEYKDTNALYRPHQLRWTIDPNKVVLLATPEADGSFASVPPELLHKYNAYDVQATRQLFFYFTREQKRLGLTEFNKHLVNMSNTLARVEGNGLTVDMVFNEKLGEQFQSDIDRLSADFTFNPRSVPQLKAYFKEQYGVSLDSTNEETITELSAMPNASDEVKQFCTDLLEYRRVTKLKSTYVDSVKKKGLANAGKIFPSFVINQATTGRLASKNPNVQNMPRLYDIKRQFIPSSPEMVFIHADYSQLELRVLTWLAQDEAVRNLFNDPNRDVFTELTQAVYGLTEEEFYALDLQTRSEYRVITKSFAYGIVYGRTAYGIAQDPDLTLTVAEAEQRMDAFKLQIPTILEFQQGVKDKIRNGDDLVNIFGRRRRFHILTNQNKEELEKQAMAFLPQSTASDICITALSRLPRELRPVNVIHDAILIEAPIAEVEEYGKTLIKTMIDTAEEFTHNYVKFDVDATWGSDWQSSAKTKKDKSNLITLGS